VEKETVSDMAISDSRVEDLPHPLLLPLILRGKLVKHLQSYNLGPWCTNRVSSGLTFKR
jgi:hypothetical protein